MTRTQLHYQRLRLRVRMLHASGFPPSVYGGTLGNWLADWQFTLFAMWKAEFARSVELAERLSVEDDDDAA